jgi:hypothetical protein
MATVSGCVIQSLRMLGNPLVPDDNRSGFISNSTAEVMATINMVEEELEQVV